MVELARFKSLEFSFTSLLDDAFVNYSFFSILLLCSNTLIANFLSLCIYLPDLTCYDYVLAWYLFFDKIICC